MAVKATKQFFQYKDVFDNYADADEVLKNYVDNEVIERHRASP